MFFTARRQLEIHRRQYDQISAVAQWEDPLFFRVREKLSLWSIAQQLHHTVLVARGIYRAVDLIYQDESPELLRPWLPNLRAPMILMMGRIPRGRSKTPAEFDSPPEVSREEVIAVLREVEQEWRRAEDHVGEFYKLRGRLPHPAFGPLDARQWLRFLTIHNRHHLELIRDIAGADSKGLDRIA